jgi:hypothetical protein
MIFEFSHLKFSVEHFVESAGGKLCGTVIGAPVGAQDAGDAGYSHDVAPLRANHLGKERFYNLQFPKEKESQSAHKSCVLSTRQLTKEPRDSHSSFLKVR